MDRFCINSLASHLLQSLQNLFARFFAFNAYFKTMEYFWMTESEKSPTPYWLGEYYYYFITISSVLLLLGNSRVDF